MLLRGLSIIDEKPVIFSIEDRPIRISEDRVALTKAKGTLILTAKSISRGSSEHKFFEGDTVLNKKGLPIGTVVYRKGFKLYNNSVDGLTELPPLDEVSFTLDKPFNGIPREEGPNLLWIYKNMELTVDSFLVYDKKRAILKANGYQPIPINQIKLSTGMVRNGRTVAFGDTCGGGTVVLHGYVPMIKKLDNSFVELKEA